MGKSQTYRKKRGGKYLGRGTYGCAFSPALYCKTNGDYRKPHVLSKLMNEEHANDEYSMVRLLKPVDPEQRFFLYPTGLCKPDFKRIDPAENNLDKCIIYESKLKKRPYNARIVESVFGGENLHKTELNTAQIWPFFRDFSQLLEGLAILHSHGLAHLDIKDLNIVTQQENSGRFDFHFIDFGFLTKISEFDTSSSTPPIGSSYSIWPYELRFATWSSDNTDDESVEEWKKEANDYFGSFLNTKYITQYTEDEYKQLFTDLQGMERNTMLTQILQGADVYSLGLVLAILWYRFIGHKESDGEIVPIVPIITNGKNMNASYKYAKAWYSAIAKNLSPHVYSLVHEMMTPDLLNRLTAQQAYEKYEALIAKMKYYLPREKIGPSLRLANPSLPSPPPVPPTPHGLEAISSNLFDGGKRNHRRTRKSRK